MNDTLDKLIQLAKNRIDYFYTAYVEEDRLENKRRAALLNGKMQEAQFWRIELQKLKQQEA